HLAAVHRHVSVRHELAGSSAGVGKAEAVNDVIEAGFEKLQQDFAGHTTTIRSDVEVTAELALQNTVLKTELLLLGERNGVLRLLAAGPLRAVHAGGIILALKRLGRAKNRHSETAADLGLGTGITSHKILVLLR